MATVFAFLGIFETIRALLNKKSSADSLEKATPRKDAEQEIAYQTSAWALLDLLTTRILKFSEEESNAGASIFSMGSIYDILLEQLDKVCCILRCDCLSFFF